MLLCLVEAGGRVLSREQIQARVWGPTHHGTPRTIDNFILQLRSKLEESPTAPRHLLRADGFRHAPDVLVGSFYDAPLEEGCAFEELISFHGGIGGPQTRPFLLYPAWLPAPEQPLIGAEAVHDVLVEWRRLLNCASPPLAAVLRAPAGVRVRAASR